jgi:hypothetical protein
VVHRIEHTLSNNEDNYCVVGQSIAPGTLYQRSDHREEKTGMAKLYSSKYHTFAPSSFFEKRVFFQKFLTTQRMSTPEEKFQEWGSECIKLIKKNHLVVPHSTNAVHYANDLNKFLLMLRKYDKDDPTHVDHMARVMGLDKKEKKTTKKQAEKPANKEKKEKKTTKKNGRSSEVAGLDNENEAEPPKKKKKKTAQ